MKDILIVGFGLAGLSIARHATFKQKTFDIISNQSQMSSKIAGGILNPVVIKRMKPVWQVEKFLPYATNYYKKLDEVFHTNSYQDLNVQVFVHNTEQENNWYAAIDKPRLSPYLSKEVRKNIKNTIQAEKFGEIKAGVVDLKTLLNSAKTYFENQNTWTADTFEYSKLSVSSDKISYNNSNYKHIIFCEGFGVTKNPYFNNLGIYGNKGDYLIFKSKQLQLQDIIKAKYFLIPLGNDLYKFGATYQREPLNHQASESAKSQMLEALDKMINVNYEVVEQICGIRPTTRDRKPILGMHQNYDNIHILNGFGSRGAMVSPLLGKQLLDHIFEEKALPDEVTINRLYART